MANTVRANGFRPVKSLIGAPWTSLVRKYPAIDTGRSATNNSGDIYIGDVVTLSAAGNVEPLVDIVTPELALGVVVGVGKANSDTALNTDNAARYYDPDNLSKRYLAYNEVGYVGVVPAEACLFSVQSDTETDIAQGDTLDLQLATTEVRGSRTTGNSLQTVTTSANANVVVVELVESPDNDPTLADARVIVRFNDVANPIS